MRGASEETSSVGEESGESAAKKSKINKVK